MTGTTLRELYEEFLKASGRVDSLERQVVVARSKRHALEQRILEDFIPNTDLVYILGDHAVVAYEDENNYGNLALRVHVVSKVEP